MAYSSIGHMGFALVGLAAGTAEGVQGVLVYMAIYMAMTLGTFACILSMRRDGSMVEEIADLAGLARTKPAMAFFLAVLMFSLAGIPPLAGFFAKFYVFLAAIKAGLYVLAVIGVLTSVVGAYYYLLIVKIMYFDDPTQSFEPMPGEQAAVLARRRACSTCCSSSIRRRCWMPRLPRRSRCSDAWPLRSARARRQAGDRLESHETRRLHQRRGAGAGARGRARAALDRRRARRPQAAAAAAATWAIASRQSATRAFCMTDIAAGRCRDTWLCRRRSRSMTRCGSCAPGARDVALKWPNDVLAATEAKLAGILLEAESRPGGLAVVVGIGVNLHSASGRHCHFRRRRSCRAAALSCIAETMFARSDGMHGAGFEHWDGGRGFAAIRDCWLERSRRARRAGVREHGRTHVAGMFETLDEAGGSILRVRRRFRDRDRGRRRAFRRSGDAARSCEGPR